MEKVIYIKRQPKVVILKTPRQSGSLIKRERYFFILVAVVGIVSMGFAVWPYFIWQVKTLPRLSGKVEDLPIPSTGVLSVSTALVSNIKVIEDEDGFSYFSTDYKREGQFIDEFVLSIPRLEIKDATVKVDNLNFYKNLSHFPGSPLPGEVGNSFITGHSVLPQFNDPKNYRAIFTKLSDLEIGDDVYVDIEGETLHFLVQYSKVVNPRDLSVLAPITPDGRNLTLMTCVPPGTNLKRLVVVASLI